MDYVDLPITSWKVFPFVLAWGKGIPNQERHFYLHDNHIYKLWSTEYNVKNLFIRNGQYIARDYSNRSKTIASMDIGFINKDISPAFIDLIWKEDICIGYVMEKGNEVDTIPQDFFEKVLDYSLRTGFFYVDFCAKNICEINGVFSLIDLDTPLTELATICYEFETKSGVLREHVDPRYRSAIVQMINEQSKSNKISMK